MDELSYRNIWVSLAVAMPIMAVAVVLLRNDEVAKEFAALATMIGGMVLLGVLDKRERRRKGLLPPKAEKR